jgi:hypothetical protein
MKMLEQNRVELFVLKCTHLSKLYSTSSDQTDTTVELDVIQEAGRALTKNFMSQIDPDTIEKSNLMSEYYKLFYALEVDIRNFVTEVMEEQTPDWWSVKVPDVVKSSVARNQEKEQKAAVTLRSNYPIDYTTFGELGEIIKSNWDAFGGMISDRQGLEKVIGTLNLLRGPIAHCGFLSIDEQLRLRLSIRDWFRLFEK